MKLPKTHRSDNSLNGFGKAIQSLAETLLIRAESTVTHYAATAIAKGMVANWEEVNDKLLKAYDAATDGNVVERRERRDKLASELHGDPAKYDAESGALRRAIDMILDLQDGAK